MNIEEFRNYCISKKNVSEDFPFDKQTLVFKVMGKMFALCDIHFFIRINLKCEPTFSDELREQYKGITPGYHMNKKHWNTVSVCSDVPDSLIYKLIDHSYHLVIKSLPQKIQKTL
ncbi:MAG: MmcQ/YjbR family DNA-binding protein [Flavobacteriales bacterium]|nr:MmcQ/YjbR family DNA-binding protein [Flavobacteriales bacterium]